MVGSLSTNCLGSCKCSFHEEARDFLPPPSTSEGIGITDQVGFGELFYASVYH